MLQEHHLYNNYYAPQNIYLKNLKIYIALHTHALIIFTNENKR